MRDCLFCKMVEGMIPCYKVYEDDYTIAFLDNSGDVRAHTLVIPKRHAPNMLECSTEIFTRVMATAQKVARSYMDRGLCDGVNILINTGEAAEQQIMHFHVHVIPRVADNIKTIYADLLQNAYDLEKVQEEFKLDYTELRKYRR